MNTKKEKKITNLDKLYDADYYKIKNKYDEYNKYNFTQRVLLPESNKEKTEKTHRIRICGSQEKDLRHTTDGTIKSLLMRTPVNFQMKGGRKRIKKSFDSGNRPDNEIFFEYTIGDLSMIGDRLYGVERKLRSKVINIESETPPFRFGRKHFYDKDINTTSIY